MEQTELYYQLAQSNLQDQDQRNRELELKATAILGVTSTLVGIGVLVLKTLSGVDGEGLSQTPVILFMSVLGAGFLIVFFGTVNALRPRDWRRDPELADIEQDLTAYEPHVLEKWVGDQVQNNVNRNEPIVDSKVQSLLFAITGLGVVVGAFIVLGLSALF